MQRARVDERMDAPGIDPAHQRGDAILADAPRAALNVLQRFDKVR